MSEDMVLGCSITIVVLVIYLLSNVSRKRKERKILDLTLENLISNLKAELEEPLTVKQICEKYLKSRQFDGLHSGVCSCKLDDLMPCENADIALCKAGYLHKRGVSCVGCEHIDEACRWCIKEEKPIQTVTSWDKGKEDICGDIK